MEKNKLFAEIWSVTLIKQLDHKELRSLKDKFMILYSIIKYLHA